MFDLNRLKAIFNPINDERFQDTGNIPPDLMTADPLASPNANEHPMMDQFLAAINQMPVREKPSLGRKFLGILPAVAGDDKGMEDILHGPYNRKMEDWKSRIQPLYQAAGLERTSNAQEIRDMFNQQSLALRGQGLEQQGEHYRAEAENQARRAALAEANQKRLEEEGRAKGERDNRRIALLEYNRDHPEHKLQIDEKGRVMAIDPRNPTQTIDTGIEVTDEAEKQDLIKRRQLAVVAAQGAQARTTKETPPGKADSDTEKSDSQKKVERALRIEKFKNEHPEYRDYINDEGQVAEPTSSGIMGAFPRYRGTDFKKEVRDAIVKHIEEGAEFKVPSSSSPSPTTPPSAPAKPPTSKFTGKAPVAMIGPDGKTYNVPADKVEQAKKDGMRVK